MYMVSLYLHAMFISIQLLIELRNIFFIRTIQNKCFMLQYICEAIVS